MGWKIAHGSIAAACVQPSLTRITPGAVVGPLLRLFASPGLRLYLPYFDSYGALGAVIILLIFFYLTGIAILIGR